MFEHPFDKDWPVQYITHYNTLPSALHHLKEPTMKQEKAIFACGCFWAPNISLNVPTVSSAQR